MEKISKNYETNSKSRKERPEQDEQTKDHKNNC